MDLFIIISNLYSVLGTVLAYFIYNLIVKQVLECLLVLAPIGSWKKPRHRGMVTILKLQMLHLVEADIEPGRFNLRTEVEFTLDIHQAMMLPPVTLVMEHKYYIM